MKPLLRRLLLWVALPVLLLALAVWSWTPREPSWEGRSLSEWLKYVGPDLHQVDRELDEQNRAAAVRAIQGMGTNCLPFLLRRLRTLELDATPLELRLIRVEAQLVKHSVITRDYTTERVAARYNRLYWAFHALGHQAAPAVPELQMWLFATNKQEVSFVADMLTRIHPEGTAALIAAVTNRTIINRMTILFAVAQCAGQHSDAYKAFLERAEDPAPSIRAAVAGSLLGINRQAPPVFHPYFLPVMVRLLADPESSVRHAACLSLEQARGDISAVEPSIAALSTDPDPRIRGLVKGLLLRISARHSTAPHTTPVPPQ